MEKKKVHYINTTKTLQKDRQTQTHKDTHTHILNKSKQFLFFLASTYLYVCQINTHSQTLKKTQQWLKVADLTAVIPFNTTQTTPPKLLFSLFEI